MSTESLQQLPSLAPGRYIHYKGGEYQVYGVARHSESEEFLVVYRPLYGAGELWVRPYSMFIETIEINGEQRPRFALAEEITKAL
ncbi:DUF1653 domain-containing protein [Spongiibacter sp. KMU-158]|uniref:DUF1653 domain-containing protein n=1 Tax=Spongiibacter pelagi TaxID=2760804 RepID=A0A927GVC6_9GAMM|nr:DUF1653 domain-containing protein [Spongiibacter pelagi]MBD2858526.1 DUF1653 domain-containing protein [Spongiibacter pelagi]